MFRSEGSSASDAAMIVGSRSIMLAMSLSSCFAGILLGQRMIAGTRTPPSQLEYFPPRSGSALAPFLSVSWPSGGPLSDRKITSVRWSISSLCSSARTFPRLQSSSIITSPYRPRRDLPANLELTPRETCGMLWESSKKNGAAVFERINSRASCV